MIATLQRLLSAMWMTAAVSAFVAGLLDVIPWSVTSGVVVILFVGHALVLAAEFAWMQRANRSDPTGCAEPPELLRAWWTEVRHAPRVFFWQQPWRHTRWPNSSHFAGPSKWPRGLVLVHGYFCNRGLWNRWLQRCTAEGIPVVAVTLEPAFGSIDAYQQALAQAVADITRDTGAPPIVVAHSMGGLAVRRWWATAPAESLHRLFTLGSPHRGTRLARFGTTTNARQMREGAAWLQHLQNTESVAHRARTLCVFSHCDNIVFPAANACLPGAKAFHHLPGTPHVAMVDHPEVWRLVCEALTT